MGKVYSAGKCKYVVFISVNCQFRYNDFSCISSDYMLDISEK